MSRRAVAPVVGVVLLVGVTVVLAAIVGAFAIGIGDSGNAPEAAITAKFGNEHPNQINLTHHSGDALDVTELTVRVYVDGESLAKQPKVPGTNPDGFRYPPTGPFNSASSDHRWTAGETASFIIASTTNSPQPSADSQVTVKIYTEGEPVATARV
ncbi:type IV pilin [Halococcus dombrowskii]|uniref:Type IV pilin n=1 Tax=Halococcus dombrowskii TaxID=179637 RepID=A0AAV3SMC8_HALDO|nr:type IV pilin [Halococcus dombrowskii]UOO95842.1 type IV pilin [Halococcus dombrowskii]